MINVNVNQLKTLDSKDNHNVNADNEITVKLIQMGEQDRDLSVYKSLMSQNTLVGSVKNSPRKRMQKNQSVKTPKGKKTVTVDETSEEDVDLERDFNTEPKKIEEIPSQRGKKTMPSILK